MKNLIVLLVLTLTQNVFAVDLDIFKEKYPPLNQYQTFLFSKLRNYFELLPSNSVVYLDTNGTRTYKVHNNNSEEITTIYSKITRTFTVGQIVERVSYFLKNGNSFGFEVIKKGNRISPSNDLDLLTLNLKKTRQDEFYQIKLPIANIEILHTNLKDGEMIFLNLGLFTLSVKIESQFKEREASLNYFYFSKEIMPSPQASLTVRALEATSDWSGTTFLHSSSQSGEISPKQFFQGINQGAGAFIGASEMLSKIILDIGFPKLN